MLQYIYSNLYYFENEYNKQGDLISKYKFNFNKMDENVFIKSSSLCCKNIVNFNMNLFLINMYYLAGYQYFK